MNVRIHDVPAGERPRERLATLGAGALTEAELLGILLRTGMRGRSAVSLGSELLQRFGGLAALAKASAGDLARVKGVGMAKAIQLKAAFEVGARLSRMRVEQQAMSDPRQVAQLVGEEMRMMSQESVRAVLVNAKLMLLGVAEVSRGLLDQALVAPREVYQEAILRRAYGVILVHNHPSGDPTPSEADVRLTRSLAEAGRVLDVPLLDHIVIGSRSDRFPEGWFSFKSAGIL